MLCITVELLPNGSEKGRRELARALVSNVKMGNRSSYRCRVSEIGVDGAKVAELRDYPRWAAPSIWDLVLRAIAVTLTGKEELPARPRPIEVPVFKTDTISYVRLRDIPEPARTAFIENMRGSTCPLVEGEADPFGCVYAWDWEAWINGQR